MCMFLRPAIRECAPTAALQSCQTSEGMELSSTGRNENKKLLFAHDWLQSAFASTNSAINMRSSLIEDVVTKGGYCDE